MSPVLNHEPSEIRRLGEGLLKRLARLLPEQKPVNWDKVYAATWTPTLLSNTGGTLQAHTGTDPIELNDLFCIDAQKRSIVLNTRQFLAGYPANNVLLWGARGTGKSSLIHALLNEYQAQGLRLIEVRKEGLSGLPWIVEQVHGKPYRFILVCDDLSFEADDPTYKTLKSVLEGSVFKASENVLIYATSNRRHLLPESMSDNLAARMEQGELHEGEAIEEKISLSDRFGLWLSFYPFRQEAYLTVLDHWLSKLARENGLPLDWLTPQQQELLHTEGLAWARSRGVRSGRTAQYFARHTIGQQLLKNNIKKNQ